MPVSIEVGHPFLYWVSDRTFCFSGYLQDTLEVFAKDMPVPVRILRNSERLGLMKARLKGTETR